MNFDLNHKLEDNEGWSSSSESIESAKDFKNDKEPVDEVV